MLSAKASFGVMPVPAGAAARRTTRRATVAKVQEQGGTVKRLGSTRKPLSSAPPPKRNGASEGNPFLTAPAWLTGKTSAAPPAPAKAAPPAPKPAFSLLPKLAPKPAPKAVPKPAPKAVPKPGDKPAAAKAAFSAPSLPSLSLPESRFARLALGVAGGTVLLSVAGPALTESGLELIGIAVTLWFAVRLVISEEAREDLSDLLALLKDRTGLDLSIDFLSGFGNTASKAAAAAAAAAQAASASAAAKEASAASAEADAAAAAAAAAEVARRAALAAAEAALAASNVAAAEAEARQAEQLRVAAAAAWADAIATALKSLETLAVVAPAPAAVAPADGPAADGHIVDVLSRNPQGVYSVLLEALERTGLNTALARNGSFTLFAPSNDAFAKALAILKLGKEDLLALPNLAAVLEFHVVPGRITAAELQDGMIIASAMGAPLRFARAGDSVRVNGAAVVTADLEATNGLVHIIDELLLPRVG